jgi:hypothetical protein
VIRAQASHAGKLEVDGDDPEQLVFCIHECHQKPVVM